MKFRRHNYSLRIAVGHSESLPAGSGAAIKNSRVGSSILPGERGDKLRTFILNDNVAIAKGLRFRDIPGFDATRCSKEISWRESDPFPTQLVFGRGRSQSDHGLRNGLIVFADLLRRGQAELVRPSLHQPRRVREGAGENSR